MAESIPTILVVEDDRDTRNMVGRLLTLAGYAVRLAESGWEGLLLLEHPADLILLDIMMPGMDGVAFLRSLRGQAHTKDVPVIVMTALDRRDVEPIVRPFNVSGILLKGGNGYEELMKLLGKLLEKPRARAHVTLPEAGSLIRPYLDLYLKMLAWS